ncbi:ABC transporter ATP-binding protein [Novispirillum sp. DQ9]|uniref:ABC transporter ATP-binding protein n=1 Tax=Novispirillum sp. DQ9 TaxID=3398612 RepID=UPI003C7EC362
MTEAAAPPRLDLRAIDKRYPGCHASKDVSLSLRAGEIHALLGENGAGKSTLVKIIYGVTSADSGEMLWEGRPVHVASPAEARRLGIGMVFQHFSLFDSLTVAENIVLGLGTRDSPEALAPRITDLSARYGLPLDPRRHVHDLSVGERQRVEIIRALLQDPKLLIMDEPTSVLTPQEADKLFETLRRLREEGRTILYISHKLEEIRALCDRATVLRAGAVVATCDPRQESARSLAQMMIGSELVAARRTAQEQRAGEPRLVVENLSLSASTPFGTDLKEVSFAVRAGEIFGIAGVAGNGQGELMLALSGEHRTPVHEAIRVDGRPVGRLGPRQRRDLGMGLVPEERLGRGAVPDLSLAENALLSGYGRQNLVQRGMIRFSRVNDYADRIIGAFNVIAHGRRAEARSLSGGNLQKFIIGREILQKPKLLICSQPTWGVDAGSAAAIHQALLDLRDQGAAVLVISQDLDELFTIADRLAVMSGGRLSSPRAAHDTSVEQVGLLMGGLFDLTEEGEAGHAQA